jgi:hypothetical protein
MTHKEIREMFNEIKDKLNSKEQINIDIIIQSKNIDTRVFHDILRLENKNIFYRDFLKETKKMFLNELSFSSIKKYKDLPIQEWDFLTQEQQMFLKSLEVQTTRSKLSYLRHRTELMAFRKLLLNFIETTPLSIDLSEIGLYFTKNYSYIDSIRSMGLVPTLDEDGNYECTPYKYK